MKKRIVAVLCISIMILSMLAGCQGSTTTENNNTEKTGTASTEAQSTTPIASSADKTAQTTAANSKEAPALAAKVKSGELPSLEERIPVEEDVMVETMDSVGTYGDNMTFTFEGKGSKWTYGKMTEESLFRFKNDGSLEPNVAKGYDVNENATEYLIYLRKGMKWSDGEEFTADDVTFFYNHMCVPETFGKSLWDCFYSSNPETGEKTPATMEKVDDYTVKVSFVNPKPTFLENVAINAKWLFAPQHFYEKILPEFIGEEAAEKKAKEMGYSDVAAMGKETGYYYWNVIGRPTLRPWVTKNDPESDLFIMERNPYYWKVDSEGKQLPYIDELHFVKTADEQQNLLMVLAGDVDLAPVNFADITTLMDNKEKGGYDLIEWQGVAWSDLSGAFQLNQTVKDKDGTLGNQSKLFQDIRFRKALSIAVDRNEVAAIVSDGFSKPTQASPPKGTMGYSEEWENKWTEYDPTAAEKLLVDIGLVKGSDGYYDFADGTDFILDIQTCMEYASVDKTAELLMKYWDAIGIKTTYKLYDRTLLEDMMIAGNHEAILAPITPMSSINPALRPDTIVPVRNYAAWYGDYGTWYASNGEEGVEPTGDIKELIDAYNQMLVATAPKEIESLSMKILELHKKNIWQIGYMSASPVLIAKNAKLKNVPEEAVFCDEFRDLGIAHFQNLYYEK